MSDQPNIVYIFTDQQSALAMSCAGNGDLHTPAMDRLAEQGVRFELAYCANPICTPSRASMMTGRMPHELDIFDNGKGIPDAVLPQSLGFVARGAGYDTAWGGKWHLPEGSMPAGTGDGAPYGFDAICPFNDYELAGKCVEYIEGHKNSDRPFLLCASFDNPHNICEWARHQPLPWGPIDDVPIADCPELPANFAVPPYECDILRDIQRAGGGVYPTVHFSHDDWRRYRHAYYRLCERVDQQVGRIVDAIDNSGLHDNTVVIFSSDHGDGHGAHRWNQKSILYDEVTRIPLIIRDPRNAAPGSVDRTHLVSNGLDLLPTVCDYAGCAAPDGLRGHSLRPLANGTGVDGNNWRDYVVSETLFFGGGPRLWGRMVRTRDHKYCVYSMGRYREQLWDTHADPGEMVNLAYSSNHADTLGAHRAMLREWGEATSDYFPWVP